MDFSDFPNYFQAASKAAAKYQRYYKSIKRSAVILLILAVVVALYGLRYSEDLTIVYSVVGVLLWSSFVLAVWLMTKKYDQLWQDSLSLESSCKTATWQFIMEVGEFATQGDRTELQKTFDNRMQKIVKVYQQLIPNLDTAVLKQELITDKMFELRTGTFEEKKSFYGECRIRSLSDHYFNKVVEYHQKYKLWSLNLVLAHVFAVGAIIFLLLNINATWSSIVLVTMLVSSILSWLELQSNLERKQRYTLALRELEVIQQELDSVEVDAQLADFVQDTERVISSPHAFWLVPGDARRKQEVLV